MTIQNIFTLIGLAVGMASAYMMYHFTPKVSSRTFIYTRAEEDTVRRRDKRKNNMLRFGMLLLFIGFLFQAIALFIR